MTSSKPTRVSAAAGLAAIAVWFAVTAFEALTTYPWNQGDSYQTASEIVHGTTGAVIVAVGFVWLAGRRGVARRS